MFPESAISDSDFDKMLAKPPQHTNFNNYEPQIYPDGEMDLFNNSPSFNICTCAIDHDCFSFVESGHCLSKFYGYEQTFGDENLRC